MLVDAEVVIAFVAYVFVQLGNRLRNAGPYFVCTRSAHLFLSPQPQALRTTPVCSSLLSLLRLVRLVSSMSLTCIRLILENALLNPSS